MTLGIIDKERRHRKGQSWSLGLLIAYAALQMVIPLRHLLYVRDLEWTHEGSNFSWRMMADHHETTGSITIEDPRTGNVYLHSPDTLLTRKQLAMVNTPYMLFQYVQFLRRYVEKEARIKEPIIRADIQVSVNGRPFQQMYDPTADLSHVNYSAVKELNWVMPFKKN